METAIKISVLDYKKWLFEKFLSFFAIVSETYEFSSNILMSSEDKKNI